VGNVFSLFVRAPNKILKFDVMLTKRARSYSSFYMRKQLLRSIVQRKLLRFSGEEAVQLVK